MNKNKIVLFIFLLMYFISGLLSCAKKQAPDTPFTRMIGKWKLTQTGSDNGSGVVVYTPVTKAQDWTWTFNNNSTAIEMNNYNSVQEPPESYSWRIVDGDSLWMAGAWHDTTTYYVFSINSSVMTLTYNDLTTGTKIASGLVFTKK